MQAGALLHLTDGIGHLLTAAIREPHKKHCVVEVAEVDFQERPQPVIIIAISPLKNSSRFEWFLEKATEMGVSAIIPLICTRTEKPRLRIDRLQNILVSAMLQSQQTWLPVLHGPTTFAELMGDADVDKLPQKFIAHCADGVKQELKSQGQDSIILIGPEGDFTEAEVDAALKASYLPVTLGGTRLRTETAGVAAAVMLKLL